MFKRVTIGFAAVIAVSVIMVSLYAQPSPSIKVGVILATSGGASYIGKPELAVLEELNKQAPYRGRIPRIGQVELIFHDSGGSPDQALQALEVLSRDPNVIAVIGSSTSGESIPLAKKAMELELPLLSLAASSKIVEHPDDPNRQNPWVFKFAQNDDLAARRLLMLIKENIPEPTVALLYSNDGFGKSGSAVVAKAAPDFPEVRIVVSSSFASELVSAEPVLAGIPSGTKSVLIWGTSPGPGLIVRALRKQRPDLAIYLSHGNASPAFLQSVGDAADGVYLVGSSVLSQASDLDNNSDRERLIKSFQGFWTSRFKSPPSQFAGYARDAFEAVIQALGNSEKFNRDSVRANLEKLEDFQGVTGTFRFSEKDHAGLDISAFETFTVKNGQFVRLRSK